MPVTTDHRSMEPTQWEEAMLGALDPFGDSEVVVRCDRGERQLHVLEASSPSQRRLGLMFRTRSEFQHDGMLFRYPSDVTAAFTMTNTWMPLRVYWFNSEGACVGSADLEALSSKQAVSPRPFRYALEIPLDRASSFGANPFLVL